MSLPRLLAAAAALVVAVIFGSQLTTGALWTTSASLGAGTVSSGTLDLVSGDAAGQSQSYTFTALNGSNLAPGGFVQAPVTLNNTGDIDYTTRLTKATQTSTALAGKINATVTSVASASACPATGAPTGTQLYSGTLEQATTAKSAAQTAGTTLTYCVRLTLDSGAVNAQSGQNASVALTFTATQARNA